MADRKMTLKDRAAKHARREVALSPRIVAFKGYIAGWRARGRAERLTKAEADKGVSELIEALRRDRDLLEFHEADGILAALDNFERARRKA